MMHVSLTDQADQTIPIIVVTEAMWATEHPLQQHDVPETGLAFAKAQGFEPKPGRSCLIPASDGAIAAILIGHAPFDPFNIGRLPALVPVGDYRLVPPEDQSFDASLATLSWALGTYRFTRYKKTETGPKRLVIPKGVDSAEISRISEAVSWGRDLINTPANDCQPDTLEEMARALVSHHNASIAVTVGDALLDANLPMIHAVGRAAATAPRLIDLTWGREDAPKVTLVGKGVTFDTGGLNIKPESAMLLMKKDMGGAATALALAHMIMDAGLDIRLRVLVPAVENAISGPSFRPGDVLPSHKGLTVEIGNTDAEGRLILADALALADEEAPELLIDFATLTGAARVALGPDLPPFFTDDDALASDCERLGQAVHDPVWRLPLWKPYESMLDSKIADINHVSSGPFAGSITAALFLKRFVTQAGACLHFDIYAWTPKPLPGRPEGGEIQSARLIYALLKERFAG